MEKRLIFIFSVLLPVMSYSSEKMENVTQEKHDKKIPRFYETIVAQERYKKERQRYYEEIEAANEAAKTIDGAYQAIKEELLKLNKLPQGLLSNKQYIRDLIDDFYEQFVSPLRISAIECYESNMHIVDTTVMLTHFLDTLFDNPENPIKLHALITLNTWLHRINDFIVSDYIMTLLAKEEYDKLIILAKADKDWLNKELLPHCFGRSRGGTPLAVAIRYHNLSLVKLLIELGADANRPYWVGLGMGMLETPLITAIDADCLEIVKYLVETQNACEAYAGLTGHYSNCADNCNEHCLSKEDILSFAIQKRNDCKPRYLKRDDNIIRYLVNTKKFNLDIASELNDSPLVTAINADDIEVVRMLVESGANVNYRKDSVGNTPLMTAVLAGNYIIAEYLISSGADIYAIGQWWIDNIKYEGTAKDMAIQKNFSYLIDYLDGLMRKENKTIL
jgi:ankyrin repeat protein